MSKLTTKEEYADLLSRYDAFLFDCDGVLWSGDDLIPGAKEVLSKLRASGKQVVFVTNNASKSRRSYKGKFDKMGIEASEVRLVWLGSLILCNRRKADRGCRQSEIISSSYAAAVYLKDVLKMPAGRKVYVLGMDGIEEELNAVGIQYCGGTVSS